MKELGELEDVGFAEFALAAENQGGNGASAENGCEVHGPQSPLIHQEVEQAERIERGQGIGAIVVLPDEGRKKRMERSFFRARFLAFDGAA